VQRIAVAQFPAVKTGKAIGQKKARCRSGLNLFPWRKIEETDE
jgi:hypothetical protein